ncbi:MAG: D-glycerate dehydrogenase [Acidobacteria bacterium]|nr:MAG: D-glycerate dehydrogenase [Acidobacteriota bacterium]PYR81995.1 MAG: D-glycerate dehydrogenase [Acidobacteriota bacterium]
MKPSILLTGKIPSSVVATLEEIGNLDHFRRDGVDLMPHDELVARVAGKQALVSMITDAVSRDVIEAGTDLKIIANAAVGYNNIDVAAARQRGIIVTNTPGVLIDATADLTWALILGITRRIGEGERLVRRGEWKGWTFDFMLGAELKGKQLGIVGYGGIGRAVAARGRAFGMRIAHASRTPKSDPDAEAMPLDRLLATSDVVSLHCPLTSETRHLIDQPALARMKRSAYLINTARGPVVDEKALAWALRMRLIAGAGLDVFEEEPKVNPELLTLENVILVPHLGSGTVETRTAMADLAARNVAAVFAGQSPLTPVS